MPKQAADRDALAATLRAEIGAGLTRTLNGHLARATDPCQDRGADWPCDIAEALDRFFDLERP